MPQGICLHKLRLWLINLPWREHDTKELRLSVPEFDGGQRTFPLLGLELGGHLRPRQNILTSAPRGFPDPELEKEINVEVVRFLNEHRPAQPTLDDINAELARVSGKGG